MARTIWIILFVLLALLQGSTGYAVVQNPYAANIQRAVDYLVSHFNESVGLIYESEDQGTHWLGRVEYKGYPWRYNQTFWLYSDNLFAAYALEPWRPDIAYKINVTIQRYAPPPSGKFEAIIGQQVGPDRMARDIILNQTEQFVVLIRVHDGMVADPRYHFADAMIYEALSTRNPVKVQEVYQMWNGTCLVDNGVTQQELTPQNAPSDIGFCMNSKLALLLYGARATGMRLPSFRELEAHLWGKQKENGGITTLSTGHGDPTGSANAETTSLVLLIYNGGLVQRLRSQIEVPEVPLSFTWLWLGFVVPLAVVTILTRGGLRLLIRVAGAKSGFT